MENCPNMASLIAWLGGSSPDRDKSLISRHVETCPNCQDRLEEHTNEATIQPIGDPGSIVDQSTYTDEPHFTSLRRRLSEKVSELLKDQGRTQKTRIGDASRNFADAEKLESKEVTSQVVGDSTFASSQISKSSQSTSEVAKVRIDGFRLERTIGRGGFAHVYQAWDQQLGRSVAIKAA